MKARPPSIKLNKSLYSCLAASARARRLSKQELIRRALRLYLHKAPTHHATRLTNVKPWRRGTLSKAYLRLERDWDWERIEEAATKAQHVSNQSLSPCS